MSSLQCLKVYIEKQKKDIPTWADEDEQSYRLDELQCLETYLDYLIHKEAGTLDEYYDNLYGKDEV